MASREIEQGVPSGGTTRREFVRRLGKTFAVGLGVALVPASGAKGDEQIGFTHCCPSSCTLPPGPGCGTGTRKFWCTGMCPSCCTCLAGSICIDFYGGCIC